MGMSGQHRLEPSQAQGQDPSEELPGPGQGCNHSSFAQELQQPQQPQPSTNWPQSPQRVPLVGRSSPGAVLTGSPELSDRGVGSVVSRSIK